MTHGVPQVNVVLLRSRRSASSSREARALEHGRGRVQKSVSALQTLRATVTESIRVRRDGPKRLLTVERANAALSEESIRLFAAHDLDCAIQRTKIDSVLKSGRTPDAILADLAKVFQYGNRSLASFLLDQAIAQAAGANKARFEKMKKGFKTDGQSGEE